MAIAGIAPGTSPACGSPADAGTPATALSGSTVPSTPGAADWIPIDLAFLNAADKPAGRHGFVHARGEDLIFDDGTPARFWGTNLTAQALFGTSHDEVPRQARRLARLGFNLVRLHHHDSAWVSPNVFGADRTRGTRHLDPDMLERLDWWMKCLADEGIYLWLDLHVGRRVTAVDGIDGFAEISEHGSAPLTGYSYVNGSIRTAMREFDDAYLERVNRYTGRRVLDDPALAIVLITNENDLTQHYGNALLPDKHVPLHSGVFRREAALFAQHTGLPERLISRTWEPGPSKIFLNDLEERFDVGMLGYLRGIGVRVPIATTSTWGMSPLSSLPALASGDVIDVHAYAGAGELRKDPRRAPTLIHWMAAARVAGKPVTASEWGVDDHGHPAADRQDLPMYVAATASAQGWSAVLSFAYAEEALPKSGGRVSVFQAYNDPALLAALPAAALLYRRADVPRAAIAYAFAPTPDLLYGTALSPATSAALRAAAERGRIEIVLPRTPGLDWLRPGVASPGARTTAFDAREDAGATTPRTVPAPMAPQGRSLAPSTSAIRIASDAGDRMRRFDRGIFTVDTPRTQAAMGALASEDIALSAVSVRVSRGDALVAVQSLDDAPIAASRRLLVSVTAGAAPMSDAGSSYRVLEVSGSLEIRAPEGLRAFQWDEASGTLHETQGFGHRSGSYVVELDFASQSPWLLLCAGNKSNARAHHIGDEDGSLCR